MKIKTAVGEKQTIISTIVENEPKDTKGRTKEVKKENNGIYL